MSDRMRITGMNSGMDTESIVQQLVAAKQIKVDSLKNDQKKLEWKQTAWQELNSKIYNLYSNTLSKLRLTGAYKKKTTTSSDVTKATVTADANAVDGTQTLSIQKLAKAGYLTGSKISRLEAGREKADAKLDTKLEDLGIKAGTKIGVSTGAGTESSQTILVNIESGDTVQTFMDKINGTGQGVTLSFDEANGVFSVTGPADGTKYKLTDPEQTYGSAALQALGLSEVFKNDNSVTGSYTGTSLTKPTLVKADGNAITGSENTKLVEELGIKAGSRIGISLNANEPAVWVTMKSGETIKDFVDRFNVEADGTGVSLSFEDGYMTVKGPADGTKYKLTQGLKEDPEPDGTYKIDTTIIDALGLGDVFENDNSTMGVKTGDAISRRAKKPAPLTSQTLLKDIAPGMFGSSNEIIIKTGAGDNYKKTRIKFEEGMKISDLVSEFKQAGLNASFDEANQRFFLSSKTTGTESDFTIEDNTGDNSVLSVLGLSGGDSNKIAGQDAEITLNGTKYTSTKNAFTINGLTINATGITDGDIAITTATDYKGAYDTVKEFLSEYNDLINEMDKLYNADSARKYSMLSAAQKETMSDEEVEKWDGTIKGALLRKDEQLGTIMNAMTNSMLKVLNVNGTNMRLADFGIKTLGYFDAKDFEHHAYHIDGDTDDDKVAGKDDKLMKALMADPENTTQFFANLCKDLYDSVGKIMNKTSEYSSIYKVYNDKQLKKEYDNYTKKIKDAEDKLSAYEDRWYDKFAKMETALSKLQSSQSVVSGMLGSK